ncbi:LLM class flavin-dependent oxidoreductase [Nevskia sp.]|uniref:LLM class flavin-dependent oxidoreductase n=1 Tax=Nevskia sp. TaxID=1929292 RepID=UPI003F70B07D
MNVALSVLDLVPNCTGSNPAEALRRTVDLARLAERLGYARYWFAEHHSLASVASSAPEILIGHIASATTSIRVGSGGMMLPNHIPYRMAEIFRTLEALHPGRIDLGIGRAPGTNGAATRALRAAGSEHFSAMMNELVRFGGDQPYGPGHPYAKVTAMPTGVPLPPVWILGSSGASAAAAGAAGFGYSFASHFSTEPPAPAFRAYREAFKPSANFPKPHAILGVQVVCAETDARADELAQSMDLTWLRINRNQYLPIPSPEEAAAYDWTEIDREEVRQQRRLSIVGSPATVRARIAALVEDTGADEVMIVTNLHGHAERLASYELLTAAFAEQRRAA